MAAEFRQVDVTDAAAVDANTTAVLDRFTRIDILANNAGITRDATLLEMADEQVDSVVDVNLRGVFHCGGAVGRVMAEAGKGSIVNTTSVVALCCLASDEASFISGAVLSVDGGLIS